MLQVLEEMTVQILGPAVLVVEADPVEKRTIMVDSVALEEVLILEQIKLEAVVMELGVTQEVMAQTVQLVQLVL